MTPSQEHQVQHTKTSSPADVFCFRCTMLLYVLLLFLYKHELAHGFEMGSMRESPPPPSALHTLTPAVISIVDLIRPSNPVTCRSESGASCRVDWSCRYYNNEGAASVQGEMRKVIRFLNRGRVFNALQYIHNYSTWNRFHPELVGTAQIRHFIVVEPQFSRPDSTWKRLHPKVQSITPNQHLFYSSLNLIF